MSHHLRAYGASAALGRSDRIKASISLVNRMAASLRDRLPASVAQEDLSQAGMIGLIEAVDRFDASTGVPFEAYALKRIKGAMIDSLRGLDHLPKAQRSELKRAERVISKLRNQLGREPAESECAAELGLRLDAYQDLLAHSGALQVFDAQDEEWAGSRQGGVLDPSHGPVEALSNKRLQQKLAELIERLPEKEKLVLSLHNDEDLNFKEIGLLLSVTESRVCQLRSKAVLRLRSGLRDWIAFENSCA